MKRITQKLAEALQCGNYRIDQGGGEGAGYNAAIRLVMQTLGENDPDFDKLRFAQTAYSGVEDYAAIISEFDI